MMICIHSDGKREDWAHSAHDPAEACTEIGADVEESASWRLSDAVIAVIAVGCIGGYFAGVFS